MVDNDLVIKKISDYLEKNDFKYDETRTYIDLVNRILPSIFGDERLIFEKLRSDLESHIDDFNPNFYGSSAIKM